MTWSDVLLLVAASAVLALSVVNVVAGHRRELRSEEDLAWTLHRMAKTVAELRNVVTSPKETETTARRKVAVRPVFAAEHYANALTARLLAQEWLRASGPSDGLAWWSTPGDDALTYRALLGPTFDEALFHAAKVGVVPREQAELLIYWAQSTKAIARSATEPKANVQGRAGITPNWLASLS